MNKNLIHTNESGRSMVEMLGVLAIVGVLSVGGIAGYSKAMAKYKMNKTLDQISMVVTNTRTIFGNQYSYYGLDEASAINYEIFGDDAVSDGSLKNPFGGDIEIKAADGSGGACAADETDCPSFILTYKGLSQNDCATIASGDWGSSQSSGLVSITIGNAPHSWSGTTIADNLPVLYTQAYADCAGDDASITWEYN